MKTIFPIGFFLAVSILIAMGQPTTNAPAVRLAWDKSPDARVSGYRLYWGISPAFTNSITINGSANTTGSVSNLVRGTTYYFAATCFTTNGLESDYSLIVSYTTLALPPAPLNTTLTVLQP